MIQILYNNNAKFKIKKKEKKHRPLKKSEKIRIPFTLVKQNIFSFLGPFWDLLF